VPDANRPIRNFPPSLHLTRLDGAGIGAGHVYFFLVDVYPQISGRRLLQTPSILLALFPREEAIHAAPAPPPLREMGVVGN
jgi:hypothetical protein